MADEDDAQKTEEPTGRKLQKSKEQGQTASSQEIKTWGILLTATMIIALMVNTPVRNLIYVKRWPTWKYFKKSENVEVNPSPLAQ